MGDRDELINRRDEKIKQIEEFMENLESTFPIGYEEYINDFKIRAIWERYFEKIIEAVVDLALIVIRYYEFEKPEDEESSFYILRDNDIISDSLADRLRAAKGMRNIIAHEYGKVDDNLVYESVNNELFEDVNEFIEKIIVVRKFS